MTVRLHIVPPLHPSTPEEGQLAVDAAEFLLLLESARLYGLVRGGPPVDVERCEELLARGRALGYEPADHDELARRWIGGDT